MFDKTYTVYIIASRSGTIYIGVTNDIHRRVYEHKNKIAKGFTEKYGCTKLVYFEDYEYIDDAIKREKELKGWSRIKKQDLIKSINPHWKDLSLEWF